MGQVIHHQQNRSGTEQQQQQHENKVHKLPCWLFYLFLLDYASCRALLVYTSLEVENVAMVNID